LNDALNDAALPSTFDLAIDLEEMTTIKQIKRVNANKKQTFAYKYCDWAIDRSFVSGDKPIKRLIDIFRHRLDIKLFSSAASSVQAAPGTKAFTRNLLQKATSQKASAIDTLANAKPNPVSSTVYDVLIQLVDTSDVLSQAELFRLLLERRSPVPILTPTRSDPPFFYYVKPLTFANVKLSTENYCNLATDTTLFRVALISTRSVNESESREFLKQVFGCNSLVPSSIGCLGCLLKNSCVAEVRVGFCPKVDDDRDDEQSISRYNEVLVLHTIGDYASIFPYIHDFADLFIIESHSNSFVQYQPLIPVEDSQRVIVWKSATVEHEPYVSAERYIFLESTIAQALNPIHDIIDELVNQTDRQRRASMQNMKYATLYDVDSINWINVEEDVKKHDYFKLRTSELQLQQLFVQEVEHLRSKIQTQTTLAERETADHNIRECQSRRRQLAPAMYNHSLLKCFVGVLSQNDEQVPTVGLCQFVKHLEFYSKEALQQLSRNQERAHADFNSNSKNKDKRDTYNEAKRVYASSLVTIEHLWRELSHIYVSNTKRYAHLPVLAAKHLLDGFSLELLDGDAGMLEQSWINAVFRELNVLLANNGKDKSSSRVLVLSVMGVQSSGKSTLLNLMFGTRLRASAGMCTRGVNIQLLKAEDRPEYDYILILDTEGVRAPEFSGLQGATWRDNRLATFSILPADVTIIMINNEEDTAAREILPIVMLAYQQSELAAKSTNQLKTKLFFVYTRIDTNEKNKLSGIAQSLSLELRKAAADLEQTQRDSANDSINDDQNFASELLHDFLPEDIQFLGKLKVRDKPPEDVPEFDYGYDIVKLNAYIHGRLTGSSPRWQARELSKFADYLNAIWQCVQTVDFTLSFRTVLERWAYEDLQGYCREMYGKLASLYSSEYDKLEPIILTTLSDSSLTSAHCGKMIEKFQEIFAAAVQETAEELKQGFIVHINQQKVRSIAGIIRS
jgi:GTPase Era involved in 16S rRNA processing